MNSKYISNQSVMDSQIITGSYTYNGNTYNAIVECTPLMFDNYTDTIYNASDSENRVTFKKSDDSITVFVNESLICGYDRKNHMLYVNIPDTAARMMDVDADKLKQIVESFSSEDLDEMLSEVAEEDDNMTITDKEIVLEFLAFLEGYALRFKEFHWDSDS